MRQYSTKEWREVRESARGIPGKGFLGRENMRVNALLQDGDDLACGRDNKASEAETEQVSGKARERLRNSRWPDHGRPCREVHR